MVSGNYIDRMSQINTLGFAVYTAKRVKLYVSICKFILYVRCVILIWKTKSHAISAIILHVQVCIYWRLGFVVKERDIRLVNETWGIQEIRARHRSRWYCAVCRKSSACIFEYAEPGDYPRASRPKAERIRYPAVVSPRRVCRYPAVLPDPWEPTVNPPQHFALRIDAF